MKNVTFNSDRVGWLASFGVLCFFTLFLTGCGGEPFGDIKTWMQENTQNLRGKVEPLPEFKPYEPLAYTAFELPDPFNKVKMDVAKQSGGGGGLRPDPNRRKETLETYNLESLKMVGTLQQGREISALIRTTDGNLYRVKIGSYLGQNFGMVTSISETGLVLKEIVEDSGGDWIERTTQLGLDETEQKK